MDDGTYIKMIDSIFRDRMPMWAAKEELLRIKKIVEDDAVNLHVWLTDGKSDFSG